MVIISKNCHMPYFNVLCLNHTQNMVLRVDGNTAVCLATWVAPLIHEAACSQVEIESSTDASTSDSVVKLVAFHFTKSLTPIVRDKVCWDPIAHTWHMGREKADKGDMVGI